jgi:hypothetical protein
MSKILEKFHWGSETNWKVGSGSEKNHSGFTRTPTLNFSLVCRDRPSGDAYVELETRDDQELAIMQNRKNMGNR